MAKTKQKWIQWIATKEVHLSIPKSPVIRIGTLVEHDPESMSTRIGGFVFPGDHDFLILKRHGWVVPFNRENVAKINKQREAEDLKKAALSGEPEEIDAISGLPVARNDQEVGKFIDISDTKSKISIEARKAEAVKKKEAKALLNQKNVIDIDKPQTATKVLDFNDYPVVQAEEGKEIADISDFGSKPKSDTVDGIRIKTPEIKLPTAKVANPAPKKRGRPFKK